MSNEPAWDVVLLDNAGLFDEASVIFEINNSDDGEKDVKTESRDVKKGNDAVRYLVLSMKAHTAYWIAPCYIRYANRRYSGPYRTRWNLKDGVNIVQRRQVYEEVDPTQDVNSNGRLKPEIIFEDYGDTEPHVGWCYLCGGLKSLTPCRKCPASYHVKCVAIQQGVDKALLANPEDIKCPNCTQTIPIEDWNVLWHKVGCFPWRPAIILRSTDVPTYLIIPYHLPIEVYGKPECEWVDVRNTVRFLQMHVLCMKQKPGDNPIREAVFKYIKRYAAKKGILIQIND